jgi:hypothetical protein
MINGRTPYLMSLVAGVILLGALLLFQPYSVSHSSWHVYTRPAREYLDAASHHDSARLRRQALGATAVQWALAAARFQPDSLAVWARQAEAWTGNRRGDTAEVFLTVPKSDCNMVLEFVGPAERAKVDAASAVCLEPR